LRRLGRTDRDLVTSPKVKTWKVALALFLKERSQASNPWLASRLHLGGRKYVSHLLSVRRGASPPTTELQLLRKTPASSAADRE
ncbi:MAG TPA: hypothetical protein VG734_24980, partial [Lacunisphaera sp.]|nr:hypothetical protein [Lacunisphaera sp.]